MTRVKSLGQGIKGFVNPYQYIVFTKKSANHRTHRSKKNRKSTPQYGKVINFRRKREELNERDIEREIKVALKNNNGII